jgi:hypothetical protein
MMCSVRVSARTQTVLSEISSLCCHVSGVPWWTVTCSGLDDWIYWHFYYNLFYLQLITTAHNQLLLDCDWLGSDESLTSGSRVNCEWLLFHSGCLELWLTYEWTRYYVSSLCNFWKDQTEITASSSSSVTAWIFVAADRRLSTQLVTSGNRLRSRCLAMVTFDTICTRN